MSAEAAVATPVLKARNGRWAHRACLAAGYVLAITLILGLATYGFSYYTLATAERPFSAKHALLKPSGAIGLKLGFTSFAMFLGIFVYPLRKRWSWLSRQGDSRHWLDYHVLLGVTAPFVVALHASFKFRGLAGMAFWIMVAVAISGVTGRYLYAQIPRRLSSAEMWLKEMQELQEKTAQQLEKQRLLPQADLRALLRLPSPQRVESLSMVAALCYMVALDIARAWRIAKVRRHALGFRERVLALGGVLRTSHADLERAIAIGRREAATAKQVLFLARAQQVFRLWHVVHRPFSYSFALLAAIHISVVIMMGFY